MDRRTLSQRAAYAKSAASRRAAETAHAAQGKAPDEPTDQALPPVSRDPSRWWSPLVKESTWWLVRAPALAVVVVLVASLLSRSEPRNEDVELATDMCLASSGDEWSDEGHGDHDSGHHDGGHQDTGHEGDHDSGHDDGHQPPDDGEGDCPTEPEDPERVECADTSSPVEPDSGSPDAEDPGGVVPNPGEPAPVEPDPTVPDPGDGSTAAEPLGYTDPVFTDDFDAFDEDRWFVYGGPSEHSYGEFYPGGGGLRTGEQISVDDGVLTLTGLPNGNTAGMSTEESHQQQYGLWEVRAKIPAEAFNYHSVLILMSGDIEMDFMEVLEPEGRDVSGFLHLAGGDDNGQVTLADNKWHNWAFEWTPEGIALYVDGEKWHETGPEAQIPTDPGTLSIQLDWFPEDFGRESTATAQLGVDWVNVYAPPGGSSVPAPAPPSDGNGDGEDREDDGSDASQADTDTDTSDDDDDEGGADCGDPQEPGEPDPVTDPEATDPEAADPDSAAASPPADSDAFYTDPDNNAYAWAEANVDDPRQAAIVESVASQAGARWFGDWNADIGGAVSAYVDSAAADGTIPILAAYNIPNRDCGQYSSGGAAGDADYETWITSFAEGIGDNEAVVILEADALAQMLTCDMDDDAVASRVASLRHATSEFATKAPNAYVYLDAGSSGWVEPEVMAGALEEVGVDDVRGFAVNVSNYKSTADSVAYGNAINAALPTPQHFVVDTSRNGGTVDYSKWCNVRGAMLGETSRWLPDDPEVDAHLWIKVPGDSDGECTHDRAAAPDPPAGAFSPDLATALITGEWSDLPD